MDLKLLKAENNENLESIVSIPLLPSQEKASQWLREYILNPELKGYSYYLTGSKGNGKTQTVLSTVGTVQIEYNDLTISFVTFNLETGEKNFHPSFHRDIKDSDIVVLNDMHYLLQAILDGQLNKESNIQTLIELFDLTKNKNIKTIVTTDVPLSNYIGRIGDKRLDGILQDSHFLNLNELITGKYKDLSKISLNKGMNADYFLLWNVHHTRPNIRYLLAIYSLYGNSVTNFEELTDNLRGEEIFQKLGGKERKFYDTIFNRPLLRGYDDLIKITNELKNNKVLSKTLESINDLDEKLLKKQNCIAYVPDTYADFQQSDDGRRKKWTNTLQFNGYNDFSGIFILGDPVYNIIMPRIIKEGIQIR